MLKRATRWRPTLLEAGETITQRYRLVIANGDWNAAQIEAAAEAWRE